MLSKLLVHNEDSRIAILQHYDRTPGIIKDDIESVKIWLRKQPHLPETPVDRQIENFLLMSKFSVEKTKTMIDWYYTIPNYIPEFYKLPTDSEVQNALRHSCYVPFPKLTPDFHRIILIKYLSENVDEFNFYHVCAYIVNMVHVVLMEDYSLGEVLILDASSFLIGHVKKMTPMVIKKLSLLIEKVFPNRIPAIHFINAPSFLNILLSIVKTVMNPKIVERIKVDKGASSLVDCYPKDILPSDYGGSEKPVHNLIEDWNEELLKWNGWFENRNKLKVNEKLRPTKLDDGDLFGLDGNFRKLDLD